MTVVVVPTEQLREGIVLTIDEVPLDIRKRLLDPPSFTISVTFAPTDVTAMGEEQFATFGTEFVRGFEQAADITYRSWLSEIRATIRDTESKLSQIGRQAIPYRAKERQMRAVIKSVNTQFDRMCESLTGDLLRLGQGAYDAAFRKSHRTAGLKTPRKRARVEVSCSTATPVPPVGERRIVVVPHPGGAVSGGLVTHRRLPRLRP